jgi:hypothetical protein
MKTLNDWVPVIIVVAQVIQVLILYAFRASIRIAILEAMKDVSKEYATKDDLKKVEQRIDLAGKVDRGFSETFALIRGSRS